MQRFDKRFGEADYPYENRTQVGNKKDKATLEGYIGKRIACHRPHFWGNPYPINDSQNRQYVIKQYLQNLWQSPDKIDRLHELTGTMLVCYCAPDDCHCDILAAFADTFGSAQLAGLSRYLPFVASLPETDSPVLSYIRGNWVLILGQYMAQGKDLYGVVRAVLEDFLALYIGRAIGDISGGRINAANITAAEWQLLEDAEGRDWFVPNPQQWALLQNVLGLFELRRGLSCKPDTVYRIPIGGQGMVIQQGTAQIKLGYHGRRALEAKRAGGKPYEAGKPVKLPDLLRFLGQYERSLFEE